MRKDLDKLTLFRLVNDFQCEPSESFVISPKSKRARINLSARSGNPFARNSATGVLVNITTKSLMVALSCWVGSPAWSRDGLENTHKKTATSNPNLNNFTLHFSQCTGLHCLSR
jgi:hypothetical protein